jgi:hypothetical protein
MQFGGGFGAQSFFQQWSLFVPVLTATGFTSLAWILTGFPAKLPGTLSDDLQRHGQRHVEATLR